MIEIMELCSFMVLPKGRHDQPTHCKFLSLRDSRRGRTATRESRSTGFGGQRRRHACKLPSNDYRMMSKTNNEQPMNDQGRQTIVFTRLGASRITRPLYFKGLERLDCFFCIRLMEKYVFWSCGEATNPGVRPSERCKERGSA